MTMCVCLPACLGVWCSVMVVHKAELLCMCVSVRPLFRPPTCLVLCYCDTTQGSRLYTHTRPQVESIKATSVSRQQQLDVEAAELQQQQAELTQRLLDFQARVAHTEASLQEREAALAELQVSAGCVCVCLYVGYVGYGSWGARRMLYLGGGGKTKLMGGLSKQSMGMWCGIPNKLSSAGTSPPQCCCCGWAQPLPTGCCAHPQCS